VRTSGRGRGCLLDGRTGGRWGRGGGRSEESVAGGRAIVGVARDPVAGGTVAERRERSCLCQDDAIAAAVVDQQHVRGRDAAVSETSGVEGRGGGVDRGGDRLDLLVAERLAAAPPRRECVAFEKRPDHPAVVVIELAIQNRRQIRVREAGDGAQVVQKRGPQRASFGLGVVPPLGRAKQPERGDHFERESFSPRPRGLEDVPAQRAQERVRTERVATPGHGAPGGVTRGRGGRSRNGPGRSGGIFRRG
jgi:hypothetical protein